MMLAIVHVLFTELIWFWWFMNRWITNPRQAGLLIPLCHLVLDMYTDLIGKTPQLVNLVSNISSSFELFCIRIEQWQYFFGHFDIPELWCQSGGRFGYVPNWHTLFLCIVIILVISLKF